MATRTDNANIQGLLAQAQLTLAEAQRALAEALRMQAAAGPSAPAAPASAATEGFLFSGSIEGESTTAQSPVLRTAERDVSLYEVAQEGHLLRVTYQLSAADVSAAGLPDAERIKIEALAAFLARRTTVVAAGDATCCASP
jgi:hypothetical protein